MMPSPATAPLAPYPPGTSVRSKSQANSPIMTVLRAGTERGTLRYMVAWLDEANQRQEAEYISDELARVTLG